MKRIVIVIVLALVAGVAFALDIEIGEIEVERALRGLDEWMNSAKGQWLGALKTVRTVESNCTETAADASAGGLKVNYGPYKDKIAAVLAADPADKLWGIYKLKIDAFYGQCETWRQRAEAARLAMEAIQQFGPAAVKAKIKELK